MTFPILWFFLISFLKTNIFSDHIKIWSLKWIKNICFTVFKTWKQAKCPPTDEWIQKMFYIYIHTYILTPTHIHTPKHTHIKNEYYSAIQNERLPFAANIDRPEIITLSQAERDKHYMTWLLHDSKKKTVQINILTKRKHTHRHRKQNLWLPKGKEWE